MHISSIGLSNGYLQMDGTQSAIEPVARLFPNLINIAFRNADGKESSVPYHHSGSGVKVIWDIKCFYSICAIPIHLLNNDSSGTVLSVSL